MNRTSDPRWRDYYHYWYNNNNNNNSNYYPYCNWLPNYHTIPPQFNHSYNNHYYNQYYYYYSYYNQYYWNYWNQVHDYHSESPSDERWLPYGHHQPNKAEYEYDPSQYNHDEYLNDPYLVNNNRFSETTYPAVEEEPDEVDDDNEGEEEPTFTLNEVFLEYLMQSEKRRQERKLKERQMEKEEEEKMILGVKIDESAEDATDIRKARLNEKYGDSAMEIEQLETQLQLSFNTYSDKNHPILWPVLPLNLRYTSEEVQ